jgi:hypothetical protein
MFDMSPVHILAPAVDITLFSRSLNVSSAAVLVLTNSRPVSRIYQINSRKLHPEVAIRQIKG